MEQEIRLAGNGKLLRKLKRFHNGSETNEKGSEY